MSLSGTIVCTDPLPKLVVPTTTPRSQSCIAPARISEALALPPLIKTAIGKSRENRAGVRAWKLWFCPLSLPFVLTIHGTDDDVVPIVHAEMLHEAIVAVDEDHELWRLPGAGRGPRV